jgi:hypothetical protein
MTASSACNAVIAIVAGSPWSAPCTSAATITPLSTSTACSALYAIRVDPFFILAIRASLSVLLFQIRFETFLSDLFRSSRCKSWLVGFSIPSAFASFPRYFLYDTPSQRLTMVFIEALA